VKGIKSFQQRSPRNSGLSSQTSGRNGLSQAGINYVLTKMIDRW
jgi:hypothetical protein